MKSRDATNKASMEAPPYQEPPERIVGSDPWKRFVVKAIRKPPSKRTNAEREAIRIAHELESKLAKDQADHDRLARYMAHQGKLIFERF